MFAQPLFGNTVDPVYTPSFGGGLYGPRPSAHTHHDDSPYKRTTSPIVTGTSVIAIQHRDGIVMAADTLASYGSLARFMHLERLKKIGDRVLIGAGGEFGDFQEISDMLEQLIKEDYLEDDGSQFTAKEVHSYLTRVMYNLRSKMDPFWNQILVAGFEGDAPYLGTVDLHGTSFQETMIATGFGAHLALPLLREAYRPDLSEEEAVKVIEDCMRILYYRDARAINRIQVARITSGNITISEPYSLQTYWLHGENIPRDGAW